MTKHDGHAWVGVIGASYVLPVLTATGHADVAFTVATKTDEPSWGYWTDTLGFTALGESWPADTRSRNHHFFGAIVQWFYEDLAGLRPLDPGYARIDINPQMPPGLDAVKATYESVRGQIVSAWRKTADAVEVEVVVPPNARGPDPSAVRGRDPRDRKRHVDAGRSGPRRHAGGRPSPGASSSTSGPGIISSR